MANLTFNEYQLGTRTTAAYAAKEKEAERLERFRDIEIGWLMECLRTMTQGSLSFDLLKKHMRDGGRIQRIKKDPSKFFVDVELDKEEREIRRRAEDFTTQRLYCFFGLFSEVGEVAELFKMFIAGDMDEGTFLSKLRKEMGDVLWYLSELAFELYSDESLQAIAAENLAKLADRKNRGKIHGSGDER